MANSQNKRGKNTQELQTGEKPDFENLENILWLAFSRGSISPMITSRDDSISTSDTQGNKTKQNR